MHTPTYSHILEHGTPRPRKDGSETRQIYTSTTVGVGGNALFRMIERWQNRIALLRDAGKIIEEEREKSHLKGRSCKDCANLVRTTQERVIFIVPARIRSELVPQVGYIRSRIPVPKTPPYGTLCKAGNTAHTQGGAHADDVVIPLTPPLEHCLLYKKR